VVDGLFDENRPASEREHDVRRLRDLLRAGVLGGAYPEGTLPSEAEIMDAYDVGRATVREVIALLSDEGLVVSKPGAAAQALVTSLNTQLEEAHGAVQPSQGSIFNNGLRPQVIDRSVIPVPALVAHRLRIAPGTLCLRLDYVSMLGDEPHGLATNYVLFPEAEKLTDVPFTSHWYALLDRAGLVLGESEFVLDGASADPVTARALGVPSGTPLISMEQAIYDPDGRVFNLAFIQIRADRFRFVSRVKSVRQAPPTESPDLYEGD
jgi:GntR family transcriptional regulator